MRISDGLRFNGIAKHLGAIAAAMLSSGLTSGGSRTGLYERSSYLRPTGQKLRDPANPHQKARIEAAIAKRERKDWVRDLNACKSFRKNITHHLASDPQRLYPILHVR